MNEEIALPDEMIGSYRPLLDSELKIVESSIDAYHGAIKQINRLKRRTIKAIIWYEKTIIDYEDRIVDKEQYLKHLDSEKSEYYKLLALAINYKYSIQGGASCR